MIIDCHCHAGRGDGLTGPWDTRAPLREYLRRARAAGIDRTVIFPTFHTNYAQANAGLARIGARDPGRWICFAAVHPVRDAGRVREVVGRWVIRGGFRGIKVHRGDAHLTREVCETAQQLRIPVIYDVLGQAALMEMVASEYPAVDFILPHLGSFADDWRAHLQVIDLLVRYPNLYTDTSGVRRFDSLVQAVRRAGPHKVLFGSDGPWLHPGLELYKIRLLKLPPAEEALILGGNLRRLLARRPIAAESDRPAGYRSPSESERHPAGSGFRRYS